MFNQLKLRFYNIKLDDIKKIIIPYRICNVRKVITRTKYISLIIISTWFQRIRADITYLQEFQILIMDLVLSLQ